jgi:hypothetical protein
LIPLRFHFCNFFNLQILLEKDLLPLKLVISAASSRTVYFFPWFPTYFGLRQGISESDRAEMLSELLQLHHQTAAAVKSAPTDLITSLRSGCNDKQFSEV